MNYLLFVGVIVLASTQTLLFNNNNIDPVCFGGKRYINVQAGLMYAGAADINALNVLFGR
jgi:hypothetical protein